MNLSLYRPYEGCEDTARCLSLKDLCKQIAIAEKIMRTLFLGGRVVDDNWLEAWSRRWGYLVLYCKVLLEEYSNRQGFFHPFHHKIFWDFPSYVSNVEWVQTGVPNWVTDQNNIALSRAALMFHGEVDRLIRRVRLNVGKGVSIRQWLQGYMAPFEVGGDWEDWITITNCNQLHRRLTELGIDELENHYRQFGWVNGQRSQAYISPPNYQPPYPGGVVRV